MKDILIGTITNYNKDNLKPWVESIKQSGFTGDKYMVCYNITYDTVQYLQDHDFKICVFENIPQRQMYGYNFPPNFHVCVHRFLHMWSFLNNLPEEIKQSYRYIISTDVGDVIFQSNPSTWLEQHLEGTHYEINAATESLKYKDEVLWGADNMKTSFGNEVYEHIKDNLIYNAGTISGKFQTILDMFIVIYNMCQGFKTANPDQAAYNLLLSLEPYKSKTKFNMSEDGWAAQLGTTMNPSALNYFKNNIVENLPIVDEKNQLICTSNGTPFVIVHQYNRLPELIQMMRKKYS